MAKIFWITQGHDLDNIYVKIKIIGSGSPNIHIYNSFYFFSYKRYWACEQIQLLFMEYFYIPYFYSYQASQNAT